MNAAPPSSSVFKAAAVAYGLERLASFEAWQAKMLRHVEAAERDGAALIVFPEYGLMELTGLFDDAVALDLQKSVSALQSLLPQAIETCRTLSRDTGLHILAPSGPFKTEAGLTVNRAYLCTPDGASDYQDKIVMTRFEREDWKVSGQGPLKLFDTALGKFGVLICYDSEFPLLGRALCEAGAEVLLVPSCTEQMSGFHRVRIGASSRALEGQCVAIQAPLIGEALWSNAIDQNQGRAAIYGPPDKGFPSDGVLAASDINVSAMAVAEIDRAAIARVRRDGGVLNYAHWADQWIADGVDPGSASHSTPKVIDVDLRQAAIVTSVD